MLRLVRNVVQLLSEFIDSNSTFENSYLAEQRQNPAASNADSKVLGEASVSIFSK